VQAQADEDDLYHCAFNFPAVLSVLGPQAWPDLRHTHETLCKDKRVRIRQTLAYSLHEIAKLCGEAETLIDKFELFAHSKQVDVKEGVVQYLPEFIATLKNKPDFLLKNEELITKKEKSWRNRSQQGLNLVSLAEVLEPKEFQKYIPVLLEFCQDEVSEVRLEVCRQMYRAVQACLRESAVGIAMVSQICEMATATRYTSRQDFVAICESVIKHKIELFDDYFAKAFYELQHDKYLDVKI
jgi:hypothetical protein